jgi:hypothetical protein
MPGNDNKVMHSCFKLGDWRVMASDGRCEGKPTFQGFGLSLSVKEEVEADQVFNALSEGGQVQMPPDEDVLLAKIWYGHGQVRRRMDGAGRVVAMGLQGVAIAAYVVGDGAGRAA